jgi:hypothetical protein
MKQGVVGAHQFVFLGCNREAVIMKVLNKQPVGGDGITNELHSIAPLRYARNVIHEDRKDRAGNPVSSGSGGEDRQ